MPTVVLADSDCCSAQSADEATSKVLRLAKRWRQPRGRRRVTPRSPSRRRSYSLSPARHYPSSGYTHVPRRWHAPGSLQTDEHSSPVIARGAEELWSPAGKIAKLEDSLRGIESELRDYRHELYQTTTDILEQGSKMSGREKKSIKKAFDEAGRLEFERSVNMLEVYEVIYKLMHTVDEPFHSRKSVRGASSDASVRPHSTGSSDRSEHFVRRSRRNRPRKSPRYSDNDQYEDLPRYVKQQLAELKEFKDAEDEKREAQMANKARKPAYDSASSFGETRIKSKRAKKSSRFTKHKQPVVEDDSDTPYSSFSGEL